MAGCGLMAGCKLMAGIVATGGLRSLVQLVTVAVIFLGVLFLTGGVTRWIASYQKSQDRHTNIEILETASLGNGKLVQIVRLGETYVALVQSKDSVTLVREMKKEELDLSLSGPSYSGFGELLRKASEQFAGKKGQLKDKKDEIQ